VKEEQWILIRFRSLKGFGKLNLAIVKVSFCGVLAKSVKAIWIPCNVQLPDLIVPTSRDTPSSAVAHKLVKTRATVRMNLITIAAGAILTTITVTYHYPRRDLLFNWLAGKEVINTLLFTMKTRNFSSSCLRGENFLSIFD
jgi:hypothetical protein